MSKYQELLQNPPTFTKLYDSENLREVEWEADDQNWGAVVNMINTGTSKINTVRCR